jgi:opacity protein-like surface antigen
MGIIFKTCVRQIWILSLAVSAIICPIERTIADELPRLISRDRATFQNIDRNPERPLTVPTKAILSDRVPNQKVRSKANNYWYTGGSAGVTFLGDINLTQRFDPLQSGVSQFNLQLRNLGDILSGIEQSQFAEIIRSSIFDRNSPSNNSLDNLTSQQVGDLFNRLANNPASARSLLQQSGISPQTFSNLVTNSANTLTQSQTIERLPANFRDTPTKVARLNQLGQDLNLLGQLLRRAQALGNDPNNNGLVENRGQVRTSTGIGLGTFIGYKFVDFRVEAELFYSSNAVNRIRNYSPLTGETNNAIGGNISNTTIAMNCYYDIPVSWQLKPFVGAGMGFSYLSSSSLDLGSGQAIKIDRQPLFTYQLKAGFSLPMDERTDLFMQYRYLNTVGFTTDGISGGIPVSNTIDGINLQSLEIGAKFGL